MNCDQARMVLWPEPGPKATSPEVTAAFDHYQGCPDCRSFFTVQRHLADRLHRLGAITAPGAVRERIYRSLAAERTAHPRPSGGFRLRWGWIAVAATTTLLLAASGVKVASRFGGVGAPGVASSAREVVAGSDAAMIQAWLSGRLGYPAHVPSIPDAKLMGGEILTVAGIQSGAVKYDLKGHRLTYYVVPGNSPRSRVTGDLMTMNGDSVGVIVWPHGNSQRAVVATMPHSQLEYIAALCRDQEI